MSRPTKRRFQIGVAIVLAAAFGNSHEASAQGLADDREEPKPKKKEESPELIAPQLEKFVDAEYPAEARDAGIEGDVVLVIDVDVDGHVTNASVSQGAGHGFDEAAVAAAKQFVFAPATRGGKPIPARIL